MDRITAVLYILITLGSPLLLLWAASEAAKEEAKTQGER